MKRNSEKIKKDPTPQVNVVSKKIAGFFLVLLLVLIIVFEKNRPPASVKNPIPRPTHSLIFYDQKSFVDGIEYAKKNKVENFYKIVGGITPHHLDVGFIIADFYSRLAPQKPKTIILLGPNHYERGNFKALTSLYWWQTPFGLVEPDNLIIESLINNKLVKVDEDTVSNDHAVAGSMSFIKYYVPQAKVVPILLSGRMNQEEAAILADNLAKFIKNDTVIIAPVDFSHYLTNKVAQEKDKLAFQVMKEFDYRQLFSMNNDYLDSPPSIGTLLMVMQKLKTTNMDLLYHSNSGEIQKNDFIQTTSYFSITFH